MKKIHKALLKNKKTKPARKTLNMRIPVSQANAFKAKAKKYANGNFTQLACLAIDSFNPKKEDLIDLDDF